MWSSGQRNNTKAFARLHWRLSTYSMLLSQVKEKRCFSSGFLYKKKRQAGGFFCYLITICCRILSKHQMLIKHKFVKFWYTQRVSSENSHYFGVYIYIWSFCSSNTLHLRSHISDCISTEPTNLSFAFTSNLSVYGIVNVEAEDA